MLSYFLPLSSEEEEVFYLQRDSETDLLSIVTKDAPRSAEEDKTDPRLGPKDLLL